MQFVTEPSCPARTSETSKVNDVSRAFRKTYADALPECQTETQWAQASRIRRLMWRSKRRVSLANAARLYGQLGTYNAFRPEMVSDLYAAFPDDGIQVTPAREYSVAVYLHVPAAGNLRSQVERFVRTHFEADEVHWESEDTLRVWWD